jgi:hypothetical protein
MCWEVTPLRSADKRLFESFSSSLALQTGFADWLCRLEADFLASNLGRLWSTYQQKTKKSQLSKLNSFLHLDALSWLILP